MGQRATSVVLALVAAIWTASCGAVDLSFDASSDESPPGGDGPVEPPEPGPSAYGWQLCRRGVLDPGFPWNDFHFRSEESAGWFDPDQEAGRLATRHTDGQVADAIAVDGVTVVGNWQPVHYPGPGPLRTVEGVLAQFDFDQTVVDHADEGRSVPVVGIVDAGADGPTVALEGVPSGWLNRAAAENLGDYHTLTVLDERPPVVWRLEAWADDDGRVGRVRYQTQDLGPMVVEVRFLAADEVVMGDGSLRLPDCPAASDRSADWLGFEPWDTDRQAPLQVLLDPDGNPYELTVDPATTTRRETIGTLLAPEPTLLVMDGNSVEVDPSYFQDEAKTISLTSFEPVDGLHRINLDVIWEIDSAGVENVLGFWVGPSDAPVVRWSPFELAYGTGGGIGALFSESVIDEAERSPRGPDQFFVPEEAVLFDGAYKFFDLDDLPGDDTLIFTNGFGDGVYPMSHGLDVGGDPVATVIWRDQVPWRLAFPDTEPPQDVLDREAQVLACMEGRRSVLPTGECPFDNEFATWWEAD